VIEKHPGRLTFSKNNSVTGSRDYVRSTPAEVLLGSDLHAIRQLGAQRPKRNGLIRAQLLDYGREFTDISYSKPFRYSLRHNAGATIADY
jgi:hypothetical protein